jgi:hypothetical protein
MGTGTSRAGLSAITQKQFTFEWPKGAKTLTATVGLSRVVVVEFLVKPELAGGQPWHPFKNVAAE